MNTIDITKTDRHFIALFNPILLCLLALCLTLSNAWSGQQSNTALFKQQQTLSKSLKPEKTKRIIVRYRSKQLALQSQFKVVGAKFLRQLKFRPDTHILSIPANITVADAIKRYQSDPNVIYAEPDYPIKLKSNIPDDVLFSNLWGLHNDGQNAVVGDADLNAPEAWDLTQGKDNIVVAVIDSGIDYTHIDLADNIWINPGEIAANGIDDDGNGYVDDVYGIDSADNDSDPMDELGHGTHVAGTIGARGNNTKGVTGVNWNVTLVACKIFASTNGGLDFSAFVSDAVECLDYLYDLKVNRNINIIASNNSWGSVAPHSQSLYEAIKKHLDAGILFVAAAGNSAQNNDAIHDIPSSLNLPNIISVAAFDGQDQLSDFSNRGKRSVHVAAPGSEILSTVPGYRPGIDPPPEHPQSDVYFNDLEGSTANWQAQPPWSIASQSFSAGTQSWTDSANGDYATNVDSSIVSPVIDLSAANKDQLFLGFYAIHELETNFDYVTIETRAAANQAWFEIGRVSGFAYDWRYYSFAIPAAQFGVNFQFRFRLISDNAFVYDGITLDNIGIGTQAIDMGDLGSNQYAVYNGTSMASPHVTGLLALLKAQDETLSWSQLKNRVISSGITKPAYDTLISGKRVRAFDQQGIGALTCEAQELLARRKPNLDRHYLSRGQQLQTSMLHIECGEPAGSPSVRLRDSDTVFELLDNGTGFDFIANDGVYSSEIDFFNLNQEVATLDFPDNSSVSVEEIRSYAAPVILPNFQWRDISNNAALLELNDDVVEIITLPFPVKYGRVKFGFTHLAISSNGFIIPMTHNDLASTDSLYDNASMPSTLVAQIIAPYWDDLVTSGGELSWSVLGEQPQRELVIQWKNVDHISTRGSANKGSFQVVFFEDNSDILFNYEDVEFGSNNVDRGASATVGLQINKYDAVQFSHDSAKLSSQTSMRFLIANPKPELRLIEAIQVKEGENITFNISGLPEHTPPLRFKATSLPGGASFNETNGHFEWNNVSPTGRYQIAFTGYSLWDERLSDSISVDINVQDASSAELIAPKFKPIEAQQALEGQSVIFTLQSETSDPQDLIFTATAMPDGAVFEAANATFKWDPVGPPGEYLAQFSVIHSQDNTLKDDLDVVIVINKNKKGGGGGSVMLLTLLIALFLFGRTQGIVSYRFKRHTPKARQAPVDSVKMQILRE